MVWGLLSAPIEEGVGRGGQVLVCVMRERGVGILRGRAE